MANSYNKGLRPEQIDDIVENTLNHFEKDRFVDISLDLQRYFAMDNKLLDKRVDTRGGTHCQWQVKVRNSGAARTSGLFAVADVQTTDVTKSVSIPWKKQTTNFAYDIDEQAFNTPDAVRILDVLKPRVHAALTDFAELMEDLFWDMPANSTDDNENMKPHGIPYWIPRNDTEGFNGTLPLGGGHTNVAGLDPAVYPHWSSYTGSYNSIGETDFIRRIRKAHAYCNFKEPVSHAGESKSPRYVHPTTYEVLARMQEILENRNENLGREVAWGDGGKVLFRSTPIVWVPKLDQIQDETGLDATNPYGKNPFYGIDRNSFKMKIQSGKFMRRSKPLQAPSQPTVRHVHYDTWSNFQCMNRRCNFLLTQKVS